MVQNFGLGFKRLGVYKGTILVFGVFLRVLIYSIIIIKFHRTLLIGIDFKSVWHIFGVGFRWNVDWNMVNLWPIFTREGLDLC